MDVVRTTAIVLGKPLKNRTLIQIGMIFTAIDFLVFESGLCSQTAPQIPEAWQLLVFIPLLFFSFISPSFSILRNPRKAIALFALGPSFDQRKMCVLHFVKQKTREIVLLISVCYGMIFIGEIFFARSNLTLFSMVVFALGYIEVKALEWLCVAAVSRGLISPTKKDRAERSKLFPGMLQWQRFGITVVEGVTRACTGFLKNPVRAIARRQLLYLMHGDFFLSVTVPLGGVALSVLVCFMAKDARYQISDLINVIFPFALVAMNAESALLSAQKIVQCSYYTITARDFFLANTVVAALFSLPFTGIFLFTGAIGAITPQGFFRIINFLCVQLFMIAASSAWYASMAAVRQGRSMAGFFWGFPLIALLGIMVPYYGALFPLGMLAALFLLGRGDLNRRAANAF